MSYEAEQQFADGFRDEWARNHPDAYDDVIVDATEPVPVDRDDGPSFSRMPTILRDRLYESDAEKAVEKGYDQKLLKQLRKREWVRTNQIPGVPAEGGLGAEIALYRQGVPLEARQVCTQFKVWLALDRVFGKQTAGGCRTIELRLAAERDPLPGEQGALF